MWVNNAIQLPGAVTPVCTLLLDDIAALAAGLRVVVEHVTEDGLMSTDIALAPPHGPAGSRQPALVTSPSSSSGGSDSGSGGDGRQPHQAAAEAQGPAAAQRAGPAQGRRETRPGVQQLTARGVGSAHQQAAAAKESGVRADADAIAVGQATGSHPGLGLEAQLEAASLPKVGTGNCS